MRTITGNTIESPTLDASYTYDGAGLRQSAVINGATVHYDWSTVGTSPELLSDGVNYYVYGASGTPIEQVNQVTGVATYLFTDQLGSVIMLADQTGNVVGTKSYSPYGDVNAVTGTATTPFGFGGGYTDPSGLVYNVARYYDPAIGQFISADPLEGQTGTPYRYATDNPVNGSDPTGLATVGECIGASAFVAIGIALQGEGVGCLTRTVSGGVDEIGVTGVVGYGSGFGYDSSVGLGGGVSVGIFYQVSSARHLSALGGLFWQVVLSGEIIGGGSVSVFWSGDPGSPKSVVGIEVGVTAGLSAGGYGVIGTSDTWVDANLPWGMGTVADAVWDAMNPGLAVPVELERARRDIAIAENQIISTSGSPTTPGPCSS
jgi:RHS repeat-associated protein